MDLGSPPRKKLKQARLPFQIVSHKVSSDSSSSAPSGKQQLSDDTGDDIVFMETVQGSEEVKENNMVITSPPENGDKDTPSAVSGVNETSQESEVESPQVAKECAKSNEISPLKLEMKSKLANLFGKKKVFDITADVGACDCGCEDADSDEDALAEYQEHSKKRKLSPISKEKTPKEKARRKSRGKQDSKQKSNPAKEEQDLKQSRPFIQSPGKEEQKKRLSAKVPGDSDSNVSSEKEPPLNAADVISDSQLVDTTGKTACPEKNSVLSQKAFNMFSKWRKSTNGGPSPEEDTLSKPKINEELNKTSKEEGIDSKLLSDKDVKAEAHSKVGVVSKNSSNYEDLNAQKGSEIPIKAELKEESTEGVKPKVERLAQLENHVETDNVVSKEESGMKQGKEEESTNGPVISNELPATPKASIDRELQGNVLSPIFIDDDRPSLPLTPTGPNKTPQRRLTPKQLERQKETARKQEEKERLKQERENEKKRLKIEKDEQKKKEKEEKEEQRRKEKEVKEKKKQAEQEQKHEEKKKKELLKAEEKRKKEEEKRKVDEEKKKAEEEEERKKAKASALFTSFFVPKSSKSDREEALTPSSNFMPFEVKADMRVAPLVRHSLTSPQKQCLDDAIRGDSQALKSLLYLHALKSGDVKPKAAFKTWPLDDTKDEEDICILDEANDSEVLISENKKVEKLKAKFLQFHENHRPAYRGTWRKRSSIVTGRCPFGQDQVLDYEVDSADEWEEEEPGESLNGSDDEKEQESEDEYEVDNGVFVPHGYLSDDEGDEENEEVLSPETQKAKLKLLGEEFEAQMKSKTSALKPVIIVLTAALQASSIGSVRYQKLLERRAVWREDEGPINLFHLRNESDSADGQAILSSDVNCVTLSSGPGAKKKIISEEAIPALITLVHGNQNKRVFLTNEFSAFLKKSRDVLSVNMENPEENSSEMQTNRPTTPSQFATDPNVTKWSGLPAASRISISNKIKELALWGSCPEEGPMYNRMCWFVPEETRVKYGLVDMKLPNTMWHYTLKPKVLSHSQSPIASTGNSPFSGADSRALITKFTKVMTPEEKQRQWESMKNTGTSTPSSSKLTATKGSTGKITAFTQVTKSPAFSSVKQHASPSTQTEIAKTNSPGSITAWTSGNSTTPTSSQPQVKKRVSLLVSVPRGQQITSNSHCSLLSKFEALSSVSSSSAGASSTPVNTSNTNLDSSMAQNSNDKVENCIVLD